MVVGGVIGGAWEYLGMSSTKPVPRGMAMGRVVGGEVGGAQLPKVVGKGSGG